MYGVAMGPASRDELPLAPASVPPCVRAARGRDLRPALPVGGEERERRAACHVHLAARRCRTDMLPTRTSHLLTRSPSHPHPQPRAYPHLDAGSRPLSRTRSWRSFRRRQRRCAALAPCRPRVVSAHAAAPCPPKSCPVLSASSGTPPAQASPSLSLTQPHRRLRSARVALRVAPRPRVGGRDVCPRRRRPMMRRRVCRRAVRALEGTARCGRASLSAARPSTAAQRAPRAAERADTTPRVAARAAGVARDGRQGEGPPHCG